VETATADAYLDRIGAERPARADAEALGELQRRHLLTVPFENLSIHLGEPIELAEAALVDKVIDRRRGGFCYELNGLFAALLSELGYDITLLACRAFGATGVGPPFDHLALRVDLEEPWLVDVGFGRHSARPLLLDTDIEQRDPEGTFQIIATSEGDFDVLKDGVPQYRVEPRPRLLEDFEATCWWHQTSPKSHFTQSVVCSRMTDRGRLTLSERLLIETAGDERQERTLGSDDEVLDAYRDHFGVHLLIPPSVSARGGGPVSAEGR
jgi:N-hydroxyarylamine O-acetyltransferase